VTCALTSRSPQTAWGGSLQSITAEFFQDLSSAPRPLDDPVPAQAEPTGTIAVTAQDTMLTTQLLIAESPCTFASLLSLVSGVALYLVGSRATSVVLMWNHPE
jgi:hypothetical protein